MPLKIKTMKFLNNKFLLLFTFAFFTVIATAQEVIQEEAAVKKDTVKKVRQKDTINIGVFTQNQKTELNR